MAEGYSLPPSALGERSRAALPAHTPAGRARAFAWFLLAGVYAIFAQQFATHAALLLVQGVTYPLLSRGLFLLLLLAGFAAIAKLEQKQAVPSVWLGLPRRPGGLKEWGMGAALGWAGVVACVLPVALFGGLVVTSAQQGAASISAALATLLTLLLATLANEVLFRGYPYQRLIQAIGPVLATILMTLFYALGRGAAFTDSPGSLLVTLLLGFVLAMAYLRTRALWVGWGFHFAWVASMALLFGLPVGGSTQFSPVFSTYTNGPAWLTGGGYGPEGSAVAIVVLLGLLIAMARATRDLRHRWALSEIIGAGIPVDIDGIAQRQHAEGMGPAAQPLAGTQLVQIAPSVAPPPPLPDKPVLPDA